MAKGSAEKPTAQKFTVELFSEWDMLNQHIFVLEPRDAADIASQFGISTE